MKEIKLEEWNENPFKVIGKDWMLITAEKDGRTNMMTASWGGFGIMWGKNVATVYIRPSRFTKSFIDSGEKFSICVMDGKYREQLNYCGSKSGRDEDKVKACGFSVEKGEGTVWFKESRLVLVCKKLYSQPMNAAALNDEKLRNAMWKDDVHELYIAEIEKAFING